MWHRPLLEQQTQEFVWSGKERAPIIKNNASADEQAAYGNVPQSPSYLDLCVRLVLLRFRGYYRRSHIGELVVDIFRAQIIVEEIFFHAVHDEALSHQKVR